MSVHNLYDFKNKLLRGNDFEQNLWTNVFLAQKLPLRDGILFASTVIVNRPRPTLL